MRKSSRSQELIVASAPAEVETRGCTAQISYGASLPLAACFKLSKHCLQLREWLTPKELVMREMPTSDRLICLCK